MDAFVKYVEEPAIKITKENIATMAGVVQKLNPVEWGKNITDKNTTTQALSSAYAKVFPEWKKKS